MAQVLAYAGRFKRFTITITDANGNAVPFQAGDVIRVKVGRDGRAPVLDLSSLAATANGSTVAAANPSEVKLRAADLAGGVIKPGVYTFEAFLVDANDAEQPKAAIDGTFHLFSTQAGSTGVS